MKTKHLFTLILAAATMGVFSTTTALPLGTQIQNYLVIGTGEGSRGDEFASYQVSDS